MSSPGRGRRVPAMNCPCRRTLPRRRTTLALLAGLLWAFACPLGADLGPIGLTTEGAQWFDNPDPVDSQYLYESFGSVLAAGDFNGDGADDLATGFPGDRSHGRNGSVFVRYARANGQGLASGPAALVLHHATLANAPHEYFGVTLASGDFNGDSFDDLAVAIVFGLDSGTGHRGAVRVFYGSSTGLHADDYEHLDPLILRGEECDGAMFGYALAAGDFDGNGFDDLAIGAPHGCEPLQPSSIAGGVVYVAHGAADGLLSAGSYWISQYSFGIYDDPETNDVFGAALAAGDFDHDLFDDLAIGIPGENSNSGAVDIVMGSQFGLIFADSVFWLPGALGEEPESGDRLGEALAAGDFDHDGFDDLAIGVPNETIDSHTWTGAMAIAYGAPAGFNLDRTDKLTQSSIYGNAAHEADSDHFGWAFGAGDFDGDGYDDLAIGHYGDKWSGINLGAVTILMGGIPPLGSSSRHHLIGVGHEGVPNDTQINQFAGYALAAGDFDGSGRADLAIGVPGYGGVPQNAFQEHIGAELVLYSGTKLFADGFESGATDGWSSTAP
ncbi:MAG TPA: hypothetical protein VFS60_11585 [Thermoanaerobaculia bacterium]|nr:hypothetical protein [Thermoanaerobaculia bacterium]